MVKRLSLDFETRSRTPLTGKTGVGAYKYAECPSTRILILAAKEGTLNDGNPVVSWDVRKERNEAVELLHQAIVDKWEIHAHNSQFEWAELKHVAPKQFGFPIPDINRMRCTAALCRTAGIPSALDKAAKFLKLPIQKDSVGKALIRKFSAPQRNGEFIEPDADLKFTIGGTKMTASEAFDLFVGYCENDVLTEMSVSEALKAFELKGFPLDWFLADARLNDRGVPVHVGALSHAMKLYEEHAATLNGRFSEITGGLRTSQNEKVLAWMKERGYKGAGLAKTVREEFQDDPDLATEAREALRIQSELSFAAVKKIPAMARMAMEDGHIRGAFMFCGAQKTWRWTSEKVQFTNMKKPGKKLRPIIEGAFQDVASGIDLETFSIFYGDPYEVIASLARYFVRLREGLIFDTDYSSVEARILPKLIECQRIMDKFDTKDDIYTTTGAAIEKELRAKFPDFDYTIDREQGKTLVLATQFEGGWHAVFTATGEKWDRRWCEVAVAIVRRENPEFKVAWKQFQEAFIEAMDSPGEWIEASPYIKFGYSRSKPFPRMYMRLASGRKICMPYPEKKPITMAKVVKVDKSNPEKPKKSSSWERVAGHHMDTELLARKLRLRDDSSVESCFKTWEISYIGRDKKKNYTRLPTYGGDQLQGATQATGADLLALGILETERRGYEPFLCVHDQCLAPAKGDKDRFTEALCVVPDWFPGFPLKATTDVEKSYCKN